MLIDRIVRNKDDVDEMEITEDTKNILKKAYDRAEGNAERGQPCFLIVETSHVDYQVELNDFTVGQVGVDKDKDLLELLKKKGVENVGYCMDDQIDAPTFPLSVKEEMISYRKEELSNILIKEALGNDGEVAQKKQVDLSHDAYQREARNDPFDIEANMSRGF